MKVFSLFGDSVILYSVEVSDIGNMLLWQAAFI